MSPQDKSRRKSMLKIKTYKTLIIFLVAAMMLLSGCGIGIVEILEYPYIDEKIAEIKNNACNRQNLIIAIDDYGTGLNDMSVVNMYDTKIVKLDRHLISGIDHLPEKQENVKKTVLDLHSRDILVLAEGIEEKEEFEYLVSLGVDLFQGYYLGKPA